MSPLPDKRRSRYSRRYHNHGDHRHRRVLRHGRQRRHRHVATGDAIAEKELAELEGDLRARSRSRGVGEIEAAIDGLLASPIIVNDRVRGTVDALSRACTKPDMRTEAACGEVRALRQELAAAREAEKIEDRIASLRGEIVELRERGASIAPDPVGEFYAWLTRGLVSVRDVGFGFPLFFALLIEVVSAFGPVTIAAYAEATRGTKPIAPLDSLPRHAATGRDELWRAPARSGTTEDGHVIVWIAERAVPTGGNRGVAVEALHADYARWCERKDIATQTLEDFELAFDHVRQLPELAGKIRKFGARYYGIALVGERRSITTGRGASRGEFR
jgi:hypothetical protein